MTRERVCTCSKPMQLIFCQRFLIHGWWNSQMQKPWIPSFHLCLDNYVATCQIKFCFKRFTYLKGKAIHRVNDRKRETTAKFGPGQIFESGRNFILTSHMCGQGPDTWATFCCLKKHIRRKFERKQGSRGLNGH